MNPSQLEELASPESEQLHRVKAVRAAMPEGGMFRDKDWQVSPAALPLPAEVVKKIHALGPATAAFQSACNRLYQEAVDSPSLHWVARVLDQGKPERMVALGRNPRWKDALPRVIRPDLVWTETGLSITELDNLPGGIGLTGWMGQTYAALGEDVLGGAAGMLDGFDRVFPKHDILVSREAADYEPEMAWLTSQLNARDGGARRVLNPWAIQPQELKGRDVYRFFELWDTDNVEHGETLLGMAEAGELRFTPPMKPYLEEKLWLALFWSPALRRWWEATLSADHLQLLKESIPYGWTLDPAPLPLHAEWPRLGIHDWQEMKRFGSRDRELVVKISGWSEKSWGSRGVKIGHDLPQDEWAEAIDEALDSYPSNPYLLQRFHRARVLTHPRHDQASGRIVPMQCRARLCPYYFVHEGEVTLGGVLATIVPADKKLLHGMRDGVMIPCKAR